MEAENITVSVTGKNRVDIAKRLRAFADNLDGKPADKAGKVAKAADEDFEETESEETEETENESTDDDFGADEEPPAKSAKGKKITIKELNAAAKAYAAENTVKKTKALLLKKFGTESLSEIKPDKFAAVLKALEV